MAALRMVTTDRSGSREECSLERGRGITGVTTSTGTSITISTFAGDIVGHSPREARDLPETVCRFAARRCTMPAAVKLPARADRINSQF